LIGRYGGQESFGQRRVCLVRTRLILPDTSSIALDRLPGVDPAGYAGLEGGVAIGVGIASWPVRRCPHS